MSHPGPISTTPTTTSAPLRPIGELTRVLLTVVHVTLLRHFRHRAELGNTDLFRKYVIAIVEASYFWKRWKVTN